MIWDISPEIFALGPIHLRWYGLLFAFGFYTAFSVLRKIYVMEGRPPSDVDSVMMHGVIGTIVGARLGHCFFYEPGYFLSHPLEILMIWKGGLASHGAAIGICISAIFYARKSVAKWTYEVGTKKKIKDPQNRINAPWLWIIDRAALITTLGGGFIRMGNLMNSEIVGKPTDVPWAVIFKRVDDIARHPSQVYEAIVCFASFWILWRIYLMKKSESPRGLILGLFLILIFGGRFFEEFLKENQVAFEAGMALNMGQILSIPIVLCGIGLVWFSRKIPLDTRSRLG